MNNFCIKSEKFSGPLDLLLNLIEKNNKSINDFSLSEITNEFITYINNNCVSSFELANFLNIASTLILIKSKSLLPTLELTSEEKEEIFALKDRLVCYKLFKDKKEILKSMLLNNCKLKNREVVNIFEIQYSDPKNLNSVNLKNSFLNLFHLYVKENKKLPTKNIKKTVDLKGRIVEYLDLFKKSDKIIFNELIEKQDKLNRLVSFMAVLHLSKQQEVDIFQDEFSTIQVVNKNKLI
ncbi:MAG: segregation/condensation protein A [Candidatus Pacebacteria bacterium]|nr:segregation/condensation protein A [Candidatus Paceibacterota bacterium]